MEAFEKANNTTKRKKEETYQKRNGKDAFLTMWKLKVDRFGRILECAVHPTLLMDAHSVNWIVHFLRSDGIELFFSSGICFPNERKKKMKLFCPFPLFCHYFLYLSWNAISQSFNPCYLNLIFTLLHSPIVPLRSTNPGWIIEGEKQCKRYIQSW